MLPTVEDTFYLIFSFCGGAVSIFLVGQDNRMLVPETTVLLFKSDFAAAIV
jgi:hypothetical protein